MKPDNSLESPPHVAGEDMDRRLSVALEAWRRAIGEDAVVADGGDLNRYRSNVSGFSRSVPAVLLPRSTAHVQAVVGIANEHRLPLYPISRGCNWGLGSRLPARDGSVIVDLRGMSAIREVNAKDRYAVIEPGVTQGALYDHLRDNKLPVMLDVTGSGRDTSVIGNILDRGVGYFACRIENLTDMEIVLGNGQLVRTGFWHFDGSKSAHLFKYGVGPYVDGLFTQSNFGIVTAATVNLLALPERQSAFYCRIRDEAGFGGLVDALAELHRRDITRTVVHIVDRRRSDITLTPVLEAALRDQPAHVRERVMKGRETPAWSAVGSLFGARSMVRATEREVVKALRPLGAVAIITEDRVRRARQIAKLLSFIPQVEARHFALMAMEPFVGLTRGVPSDAALNSVYAPVKGSAKAGVTNPDESTAGLLYCLPVIPFHGEAATHAVGIARGVGARYDLAPFITLNSMNAKCLEGVINIAFNRGDPKEKERAHACIDEMHADLMGAGYIPYRVSIEHMGHVVRADDPFWRALREVKAALDPNGIIAPGRYGLV
jgi:4-cresol dehydrogenase (hydroxylating) flavoprotein subunit